VDGYLRNTDVTMDEHYELPEVLLEELMRIEEERGAKKKESDYVVEGETRENRFFNLLPMLHGARLSALCLSGGGIRSATFNLGVLQGLARTGVLKETDYLSTVSGGGYIGSWLSSWISREKGSSAARVEKVVGMLAEEGHDTASREPYQVRFLRDYSNYLTPRVGIFSIDTWAIIGTYLRNLLLNWLVLLLYVDAAVSPSGTGLAYITQSSRLMRGVQQNGHLPGFLGRLHPLYGTPRYAILACLLLSLIFLFVFRGWGSLVEMITVLLVIGMIPAPLALAGIRRHAPQLLPGRKHAWLQGIEIISFIVITLLFYWSGWPQTGKALLVVMAGLPLFFWYEWKAGRTPLTAMQGGTWLVCWMLVTTLASWLFGTMLENSHAPGWDEIVILGLGVGFYYWGAAGSSLTPLLEKTCRYGVEND